MTEKRKITFAKDLTDRDRKKGTSGINRETEKKRQSEDRERERQKERR